MAIKTDSLGRREGVTYSICENVAEQTDTDICELPPLYESIDPDALDAFLRCSNSTDVHPEQSVEFSYCDYRVTIDSTGRIRLRPEA